MKPNDNEFQKCVRFNKITSKPDVTNEEIEFWTEHLHTCPVHGFEALDRRQGFPPGTLRNWNGRDPLPAPDPAAEEQYFGRLERLIRAAEEEGGSLGLVESTHPSWLGQWQIISAGARQFVRSEPALVMAAHQKGEPGWPFVVGNNSPVDQPDVRLQFDLWGFDLVVTNASIPNGPVVLIEINPGSGEVISLRPGEKRSLGDIEEFRLSDASDKDAIAKALNTALRVERQVS